MTQNINQSQRTVETYTVETDNYPSLPSPTDKIINNQKKYYL